MQNSQSAIRLRTNNILDIIMAASIVTKFVTSFITSSNVANSTQSNFGAHEVSRSGVTEQEEGGVHVLEFHIPSMDSPMAIAIVGIVAMTMLLALVIISKCVRKCLCPCSDLRIHRAKKQPAAEAIEMPEIICPAPPTDERTQYKGNGSPPQYNEVTRV